MRRLARWVALPAAAVLAALALAGCGGGGSEPQQAGPATTAPTTARTTAESAFCADLTELRRAAGDMTGLDPATTSVDELTLAAANLGSAWKNVRASAKDASGVDTTALARAWQGVLAEAKALSGSGASPVAAVKALKAAAVPLGKAADDLALRCAASS